MLVGWRGRSVLWERGMADSHDVLDSALSAVKLCKSSGNPNQVERQMWNKS
jgi:hypothetical protein